MGGLLHLVQRGGRSTPRPLLAVLNVTTPTHQRSVYQLRIIRCGTIIAFEVKSVQMKHFILHN